MKTRLIIYPILMCLCLSVWLLFDISREHTKLINKLNGLSVGIDLKFNGETFFKTGSACGIMRGGGFSIGKFEEPIILNSMSFTITDIK